MIVPFSIKEFDNNGKKTYNMCLSFSPQTNIYNDEEIKKFYYFIKKIDNINEETVSEHRKEWGIPKKLTYRKTLQRLSDESPYHIRLNLPYNDKNGFLFHVYDESANKSNIDIIEKRSIVSIVLELTDLKFTDTEYRCSWTVMQIRKFKPYSPIQEFFLTACYICDQDDPEDKAYAKLIEMYQQKVIKPWKANPNHLINSTIIWQEPPTPDTTKPVTVSNAPKSEMPISVFVPPTLDELLAAKKLLKRTKTVVKDGFLGKKVENAKTETVTDDLPPPAPPLPPLPKKAKKASKKNK